MAIFYHTLVPGDGALNPITVPGTSRQYSCAAGSIIAVPDFDSLVLRQAGWVATNVGNTAGSYGATAARPAAATIVTGFNYVDTTLNAHTTFVGPKTGWVNSVTGASV